MLLEDTPGLRHRDRERARQATGKQHGITIADKVTIGVTAEGIDAVPAAVQRLKNEGVDGIFLAVSAIFSSIFMQAAVKADYHPQYFASDLSENSTDILTQVRAQGPDRRRARHHVAPHRVGDGRQSRPIRSTRKCNATYAKQSGDAAAKAGSERVRLDRRHSARSSTCSTKAATAAGKDLTVASFVKGTPGPHELPAGLRRQGIVRTEEVRRTRRDPDAEVQAVLQLLGARPAPTPVKF